MAVIDTLVEQYCGLGWQLVQLYGVKEKGVCTCFKNADCATPGKHPVGNAWETRTTNDEETVMSWFDNGPANIGLLLGPRSGVIDIELDGPEAIAAWNSLGLDEIWTPTYSAGRGPHRLFKWDERLPAVSIKKPMGIEMRIGNSETAIQSVIPPSVHHTFVNYHWLEGLSPSDVELAPLPDRLLELLWNETSAESTNKPARLAIHEKVPDGERNETLHRFAVREAFRCGPNLDDPQEQQDLLAKVRAINLLNCKPPLADTEVINLYRSAVQYVRKTQAAEITPSQAVAASDAGKPSVHVDQNDYVNNLTVEGLSYGPLVPGSDSSPEWKPGDWRLTVVHSDPIEYRLHAPAWKQWGSDGTGNVSLTVDQYRSASKVAAAVLSATGVVMLDTEPKRWRGIWEGGYKVTDVDSDGNKRTRVALGLKAKLLDNVSHEWPGASSLRYVILAGWLYDRLAQASHPNEDDIPDPNGRAAWRKNGTLWFSWSRVWEDIERQHRIMEGERLSLKRRLLARMGSDVKDFVHAEFRHIGGTRKSYVVWESSDFAVLESMANEKPEG